MNQAAVDPSYFEQLYAGNEDPWAFATSEYERTKYAATLDALGDRRFGSGLEVGCSIGVLSRQLAERCDTFLGLDVAETAVGAAAERCAELPGARFSRAVVPDDWPAGRFDLIVFSEVLYYLGTAGLDRTATLARGSLAPGGVVVLVNWLGDTGTGMTGNGAAAAFNDASGLEPQLERRSETYRLDVLG